MQFLISNFVGVQLTDILASLAAMALLALLFKVWKPKDQFAMAEGRSHAEQRVAATRIPRAKSCWRGCPTSCWWSSSWCGATTDAGALRSVSKVFGWPGLHNADRDRSAGSGESPALYAAIYRFRLALGFGHRLPDRVVCLGAFVLGMSPGQFVSVFCADRAAIGSGGVDHRVGAWVWRS